MDFRKTFAIFTCVSFFAVGAALAGRSTIDAPGAKAVDSGSDEVPIALGRSVSMHHKTKMHHVKMKPADSIETPIVTEIPAPND
ncbi:MAG: hypothetical protein WDN46_08560 [Methylocella sp.]